MTSARPLDTATSQPGPSSGGRVVRSAAWLLLPVACHFGFSWIGFNPTDDGWMQAVARRLADGEVPHRDFIFVRPALSALLQVPLVWWGGDAVIWLSRLWGWVTLAAICWIWSGRIGGPAAAPLLLRYAFYAIALLLCAHTFPVMAWHSIDAMLLCSIAVVLAARGTPGARAAAFFVAGMAALCRQNFLLFAPLLLLATGGRVRDWFAAGFWSALPALIYVGVIAALGGARDLVHQVWSTSGAFSGVAIVRYARDAYFLGGVGLGVASGWALRGRADAAPALRWIPAAAIAVVGGAFAFALWRSPGLFHSLSTGLFGLCLGWLPWRLFARGGDSGRLVLVAGLALAWVTSISLGYNSPALTAGVLFLLLWRLLHGAVEANGSRMNLSAAAVGLVLVAGALSHGRQQFPYRDRPAPELRYEAGEVLAGARHLLTNEVTFATLADLQALTRRYAREGRTYAILTDCSAHWITSRQRNPLACEWPQETELGYSPELFARFLGGVTKLPAGSRIIVQRFLISHYAQQVSPVPEGWSYYTAQNWVSEKGRLVEETQFFRVYEPRAGDR